MTCEHPDIAIMDHTRGWSSDESGITHHVNRLCCKCYQHWAGPVGDVTEYTRAEWEALLNSSFDAERVQRLDTSPERVQETLDF